MSRDDPRFDSDRPLERLVCDLTQSWSAAGGGVGTYLRRKRRHIVERTPHRHLLIVPGARDEIFEDGRTITATIASPKVPGSPNYRLLLRNGAVRELLELYRPDLVECQDAYNLPWTAIRHARRNPGTALVAAYCTDFPTVYAERPIGRYLGAPAGRAAARLCYSYCRSLYRRFDLTYAMSENGGAAKLRALGLDDVEVVPLGVDIADFSPARRDPAIRAALGVEGGKPLLIYAGRLDREKRAGVVVEAFRRLPESLGARLLLIGDGPLRQRILALDDPRIVAPGYVASRDLLARMLASADLYVSAMADETFGISVVEAQASGLPVVGVAAGAMVDRVDPANGLLGPVNDASAMAANILDILGGDRPAMAEAAVERARSYKWESSLDRLFGELYPLAFVRAAAREGLAPDFAQPALADA
jgi:alpha-1,6-mannosyltransferase